MQMTKELVAKTKIISNEMLLFFESYLGIHLNFKCP